MKIFVEIIINFFRVDFENREETNWEERKETDDSDSSSYLFLKFKLIN